MKIGDKLLPDLLHVDKDSDIQEEQGIYRNNPHMKTDDKLALDLFHVDKDSHIQVNQEICRKCPHRICTYVCPSENYTLDGDNVVFSWEGCLECGTCLIACDQGAITWDYPRGGFGICYRLG